MRASGRITCCTSCACFTSSAISRWRFTDCSSRRSSSRAMTTATSRFAIAPRAIWVPNGNQYIRIWRRLSWAVKALIPRNTTSGQNQPALHSLPANAFDHDPKQQREEEQPEDKGDSHEVDGNRMRDKPEEDLIAENIRDHQQQREPRLMSRGSHGGRCSPNHTQNTMTHAA